MIPLEAVIYDSPVTLQQSLAFSSLQLNQQQKASRQYALIRCFAEYVPTKGCWEYSIKHLLHERHSWGSCSQKACQQR